MVSIATASPAMSYPALLSLHRPLARSPAPFTPTNPMLFRALAIASATSFVCLNAVHAQEAERRSFIGIIIGPSQPIGSFADKNPSSAGAGHAKAGYTDTFLNFGKRIGEHWGIAASVAYSEYYTDGDNEDDWYQVALVSVGPMYSRALSRKLIVDIKPKIGFMAVTPVVDSYTTSAETGHGVALDLRGGLRFNIHRRWALLGEVGLMSSPQGYVDGSTQTVTAIVSGIGFAYRPAW